MATYTARIPIAAQSEWTFVISSRTARIPVAVQSGYSTILGGAALPLQMRGKHSGGYAWWWSMNGAPDTTGIYYDPARNGGVLFSALSGIVVAVKQPSIVNVERDSLIPAAVTGTSQAMVPGYDYTSENAATAVAFTLPALCDKGRVMRITGVAVGGWALALNANQIVHFGNLDTTTGVTGGISSKARYDSITLRCVVANLEFSIVASQGSMEVV